MSSNADFWDGGGTLRPRLVEIENRMAQLSAVFIGQYVELPARAGDANASLVAPLGTLLNRAAYPALWAWAQTQTGLVVDDATWLAARTASPINACALYSSGDGSTTFRIPDMGDGGFSRATRDGSESDLDGGFESANKAHDHGGVSGDGGEHYHEGGLVVPATFGNKLYGKRNIGNNGGVNSGNSALSACVAFTDVEADHNHPITSEGGTEATPQGYYKRLYIYTGAVISTLSTPPPDWLTQQQTNTTNIAAQGADIATQGARITAIEGDLASRGKTILYDGAIVGDAKDVTLSDDIAKYDDIRVYAGYSTTVGVQTFSPEELLAKPSYSFFVYEYTSSHFSQIRNITNTKLEVNSPGGSEGVYKVVGIKY